MSSQENTPGNLPPNYKRTLWEDLAHTAPSGLSLHIRERLARVVLDEMYQFVGVVDTQGTLLEVNRPSLEAGGVTREQVLGRPAWETRWFETSPQAQAEVRRAVERAAQGEFVRYETEIFGAQGGKQRVIVDFSLSPIRDEQGNIVFLLSEGRNIVEKKQAEKELIRKSAELRKLYDHLRDFDQLKSQFFANVSHELRTPLTLILGPVQKLLDDAQLPPNYRHDLDLILRNAGLLLKHVNGLLDISKLEAGCMGMQYAEADLARLCRIGAAYFEALAQERQLRFTIDTPPELSVQIDAEKIQQVLLNLLSNAFKFTPSGEVRLSLRAEENEAVLMIDDAGPGIPKPLRESIFERFAQVNDSAHRGGGTGLGLAIVRDFVQLHGGSVHIEDAPQGGARFVVRLPRVAPDGSRIEESPAAWYESPEQSLVEELHRYDHDEPRAELVQLSVARETPLVLVVEDNPDLNDFLCEALRVHYQVAAAFDGAQGLQKALELRPDLILTDLMMPRMSGDRLIHELRSQEQFEHVPIVLLTAKVDQALKNRLLRSGVQDYLQKPFSTPELLARVHRLLVEHARTVEALRESEARFRGTFENAAVGIAHLAADGRWLRVNETLCKIVGYPREELLQMRFQDLTHPDDLEVNQHLLNKLIAGELTDFTFEKRYFHKEGRLIWVSVSASMMRSSIGEPLYIIAVLRDISRQKRTEAQLKDLNETLEQQVTERTALAEYRTRQLRRLASELTQAEQRERRRLAQSLHDHLQQILATARISLSPIRKRLRETAYNRRLEQIDELLSESIEVSRSLAFDLSPPVLHDAGLAASLAWLARNLQTRYDFKVEVDADPEANPTIEYTSVFLFQAVRELLFNVLTHAGIGEARVTMRHHDEQSLEITVEDQGRGFDVSILTESDDVEGFGLFSIRERLELLGGRMKLDSEPKHGTSVTLIAPQHEQESLRVGFKPEREAPPSTEEAAPAADQPVSNTRVLLVDDHKIVRQGLLRVLAEMPGIEVIGEAADGVEAIEMARRLQPDVVLMDVSMPKMDGIEATRQITREFPGIRVVGLSMHETEDMAAAMHAAGASDYHPKAGPLDILEKKIVGR